MDRWRGSRGGGAGEETERGRAAKTEAREKSENAWSHWWAVGVRTRQLTSIRVSQTSAALYLVEHQHHHGNTHAHLHVDSCGLT